MRHRNPLAKNDVVWKRELYARDSVRGDVFAYDNNDNKYQLSEIHPARLEFIAGVWRVQNYGQEYKLTKIRDREFILGPRIDVTEKNYFEYYQIANAPVFNCYGPLNPPEYDMVAAHYKTDDGDFWSYGKDIASARAFLGICLYDKYQDLIHRVACRRNNQNPRG